MFFSSIIIDGSSTFPVQDIEFANATSSIVLVSGSQTSENISALPSSDATTGSDTI